LGSQSKNAISGRKNRKERHGTTGPAGDVNGVTYRHSRDLKPRDDTRRNEQEQDHTANALHNPMAKTSSARPQGPRRGQREKGYSRKTGRTLGGVAQRS